MTTPSSANDSKHHEKIWREGKVQKGDMMKMRTVKLMTSEAFPGGFAML